MDYNILDLDNVPPYIDKQWIKAGKQYLKNNTLYEVLWAHEDRLKIPELHLKHLPAQNLPVSQFLWHELPPQSAEIITTKAWLWFNPDMPINWHKNSIEQACPADGFSSQPRKGIWAGLVWRC